MAEEKKSAFGQVVHDMAEGIKQRQANQPKLGEEMRAVFREGREDAWNNLIPAFPQTTPVREAGAPGTPTMQQTTEKLEGRDVNGQDKLEAKVEVTNKEVEAELAKMRGQEQSRGR